MKYDVFWYAHYYPVGGLNDHAGSVDFGSIEEVRAFILSEWQENDRNLDEYQIADEKLTVLETGDLMQRYCDGKRMPKTIEPHDKPRDRALAEDRFSTERKGE